MAGLESLKHKQRLFVEAYIGKANGNATEAARLAGYSSPHPEGSRLLQNATIRAAIQERYAEAAMAADEVLGRLAQQARNESSRYITVDEHGQARVDLRQMQADGMMHLVKGIKQTKFGQEIEFFDGQAALVQIGRHLKLFTDRTEHDGSIELTGSAEEFDRRLAGRVGRNGTGSHPVGSAS